VTGEPIEPIRLGPDGRRHVAGAVLWRADGTVLLQHRDDDPAIVEPGKWSLFGGGVDACESPLDAVLREVEEEIGYRLKALRPLIVIEGKHQVYDLYLAAIDAPLETLQLNEGQGFAYVTPERALSELDLADVARLALTAAVMVVEQRAKDGFTTAFDDWPTTDTA